MTIAVTAGYQTYADFIRTVQEDPAACLGAMVNGQLWLMPNDDSIQQILGAIPLWIDAKSGETLQQQINRNYAHGGGWNTFQGFDVRLNEENMYCIKYPGDPEYREIARGYIAHGSEIQLVVFFRHSWVMIVKFEGDTPVYDIARID